MNENEIFSKNNKTNAFQDIFPDATNRIKSFTTNPMPRELKKDWW